ncbi:SRPBCC family protein [Brevibacillus thermoruber]|uniref:SRPBCC family protein n=1 Tax=Brevibacillus TaxID=55080 RepID=UPI00117D9417|nr:SRPBCC domain-containing protein [Brevibacillus sp. LEMMJ03]TRY27133.1 SRPBCC domain-containing protein [Brevibacillus sp. LEMMJ03]
MVHASTITLTMKRSFDVSADRVFDAWLNPEMMRKWLFTMESTNKVAKNEPHVGGTWEIVDHRGGKDYRAIGEYIEIDPPNRLVFTFKMPQFSDTEDRITVECKPLEKGCEMTFTQEIVVPHEEGWTEKDIEQALREYHDSTEQGWNFMFLGVKQLVETGKINYPSP